MEPLYASIRTSASPIRLRTGASSSSNVSPSDSRTTSVAPTSGKPAASRVNWSSVALMRCPSWVRVGRAGVWRVAVSPTRPERRVDWERVLGGRRERGGGPLVQPVALGQPPQGGGGPPACPPQARPWTRHEHGTPPAGARGGRRGRGGAHPRECAGGARG